jgi:hypothetical protein
VAAYDAVLAENYLQRLPGSLPLLEYDPANPGFTVSLACAKAPQHMPCTGTDVDVVLWDDLLRAEGPGWQEVRMTHGARLRIAHVPRSASLQVSEGLRAEIVR